jgi:hypothetical protein
MTAEKPHAKAAIMERINTRWDELQGLLATLTAAQWDEALGDGWSAKAHLAHLDAWERSLLALLDGSSRNQAMGIEDSLWQQEEALDKVNRVIAERAQARALEDVVDDSNSTHREIVGVLARMTDEDFVRPYSYYQPHDKEPNENPVVGWVNGDTWEHYEEHIGWLREAGIGQAPGEAVRPPS